jgi:hypothetical protein
MADIWMDVDTALAEVPVNLMPLVDDDDFVTLKDAVVYNEAGMDLRWNFVTTGGAYTSTAVTPTTSGSYDWAHQGDAMYSIEITASGGASINNDTEGFGWFTGKATDVAPWRGPVIGFRAAAINNSMIDGTTIDVNVTAVSGDTTAADNLELDYDGTGLAKGNSSIGSVTGNVGGIAGTLNDFDDLASYGDGDGRWASGRPAAEGSLQTGSTTTSLILDPATLGANDHYNGHFIELIDTTGLVDGTYVDDYVAASQTVTPQRAMRTSVADTTLYKVYTAATVPAHVVSLASGAITAASIATNAIDDDALAADAVTAIQSGLATAAALATVNDFLDSEIAAILADTNELQTDWANGGRLDLILDTAAAGSLDAAAVRDAVGLASANLDTQLGALPTAAENAAAVLTTQMTQAYAADGVAPTLAQAIFLIQQILGDFSISGTTLTIKQLDGTTTAATFTLNDASSPTSLTRAT